MTTAAVISQRVLPRSRVTSVLLVVGAAALTALAAQWEIPLPFTPVPITGQTFAVLLTGAALGMTLGAAGQLLYVAAGALGLPIYAGGAAGWEEAQTGGTSGYLIGFIVAAAVVGYMAERRQDRTFPTMFTAFVLGSFIIYFFGVIGLMLTFDMTANEAIVVGVVPFVVGDLIKAAWAGLLLPGAWRLIGEHPRP
ncbi:MAG TPA: biotin transporter BioY [Acidimicrobiia bacterium]|nr:biotin transporter BioY [Acidimicrobiia bacterium]